MARTKSAKGNNRKQKVRKPWKHTAAGKSKDPTSTYQYSYEEIKAIRAKDVEECNFCMMQFGAGNGEKLKTHVAYFCPKLPLSYHQRSLVMTDIKNHVTHMNTDGSALFSVVKKKPSHPLLLCEINGKGINPSIAADALSWIPNRPGVIVGDPCILDFWHCRGNYDICGKKYSTSPVSMNVGKELLLKLHGIIWKVEDHKDVFQWNTNHSNRIDDRTDVNALARLLIRQHAKRVAFKEFIKAGMETKSLNRVILFMLHWHRWESSALWRKCNEKSANEGSKGKRNAGNHAGLLVVDIRYSADDTIISPVYYESFVEKDTYYKHVLWRSGHRHFCNFMKNLFGKSMCVKSENIRFYKNIIPNGCVPTAFFHAAQAKMFPVINGPSSSRTIAGLQIWLREFKRFHKQSDDNKAMKIPINKAKALFDRINHSMESLAFEFEV
ncbi:unnamed protein product [Allacma fusca]|uniref:Uncharacterized protein n=1 Tax=Allacma fusca TaxID=39272 RepID=A0A8J2NT46_9HEXA|nr:unnamed protein product [Allacma fusca]